MNPLLNGFLDYISKKLETGQAFMEHIAKANLTKFRQDLAETLILDSDGYLEPLVWLKSISETVTPDSAKQHPTFEQLLFGHDKSGTLQQIPAYVSSEGIIQIPKIGYFHLPVKNTFVQLERLAQSGQYRITLNGKELEYDLEPPTMLEGTPFELQVHNNPLLHRIFIDVNMERHEVEIEQIAASKKEALTNALHLIKTHYNTYYQWLEKVMKRMVIFHNPQIWSFANIDTYGTSFYSTIPENDEIFFIEDILHQCAHNIFYALTINKAEILTIDPNLQMHNINNREGDRRMVYGAFHGLFTMSNINSCAEILIDKEVFSGKQKHELLGKFSDNMKRWKRGLEDFNQRQIFTDQGWRYYTMFKMIYESIYERKQELVHRFDTSNQPYIFNYEKFVELNPIAETV